MRGHEELRTARLTLGRPTPADVDAILRIHSNPAACLHNPSDELTSRAAAQALYERWNTQWLTCGYGYWVVRQGLAPQQLGFCGVKPMKLSRLDVLNLFYRFDPSAWGQGLASEAATAVTDWAARHQPELPVIARVRPTNVASQRVAHKAGLTRAQHLDAHGEDGLDWIFAANLIGH